MTLISPNYLSLVNRPVLRGRPLAETDRRGTDLVALVNQSFVDRFFPEADPIGRQLELNLESSGQWVTVVGVVPDRRNLGFKEDLGPEAFVSCRQAAPEWVSYIFLARTRSDSAGLGAAVREAVQSVDINQPVSQAATVNARLAWAIRRNVEGTQAMAVIGLFGLILAALGVYGVISYSVVERTHEIGVRMALGAGQREVLGLVIKQGMKLTLIGLVTGGCLAVGVTLGISPMLFGVRALSPETYLVVGGILAAAAFLASLLPARRAARVDPMAALRYE